jgi:SAM-dependent methyltransferase
MDPEDLNVLYDRQYVAAYDDRFLSRGLCRVDTAFEIKVLAEALAKADTWLDVACGTGYFLGQFPGRRRAGTDISTAMLDQARAVNPDAEFHVHDFRQPRPEWQDAWDLVSSMWYAYGYVNTIGEFDRLLDNLADWTSPEGALFLPYFNLNGLWETHLPHDFPTPFAPSKIFVTGLIWNYQDDGKLHQDMIAPHADHIRAGLEKRFERVRVIAYPPAMPGWQLVRRAFLAEGKRT